MEGSLWSDLQPLKSFLKWGRFWIIFSQGIPTRKKKNYLRKFKNVGTKLGNKRNIRELVGYFVI